jgi:excisionase family DNA binding protein
MDLTLQDIDDRLRHIEAMLLSQKNVLNLDEVATYTGLSKSHIYKLTCTGGIPCYKPNGKHIYFEKKLIDEWLLKNYKLTNDDINSQTADYLINKSDKR